MKIFVSHATANDTIVTALRERLAPYGIDSWTDSRELTGGDLLKQRIEEAIAVSDFFVVVLSLDALNSVWVQDEIAYARRVKGKRKDSFKLIPLLRGGVKPTALRLLFGKEPVAITIDEGNDGLDKAMPKILAALGLALPVDPQPQTVKPEKPVADLIVELTDPTIYQQEGKTRAQATVTLFYVPPANGGSRVQSTRYQFIAPLGPIETGELTWYLESYFRWPTGVYQDRAQRVEKRLPEWGKLLYDALHDEVAAEAFKAWEGADKGAERRLSVKVESELPKGSPEEAQQQANEAATLLFSLPWELLHNGKEFL
ncbi:MAG TPA: toll/interleukin-1 receptor domain-containing protein, partial [Chthonomonadaceae bacterium]|nr:toll/interleukin-1 receptor domain-containing protein [Chthonomonadaceae bacterium]